MYPTRTALFTRRNQMHRRGIRTAATPLDPWSRRDLFVLSHPDVIRNTHPPPNYSLLSTNFQHQRKD